MSSTLPQGELSEFADNSVPSGCAQRAANPGTVVGGLAETGSKSTGDGGIGGPIRPVKTGNNQVSAATTKKKIREHRAAEPDALTVDEAVQRGPAGKGKLYKEIAAGRLIARKIGRRTVILRTDYEQWLNGLPTIAGTVSARQPSDLEAPSALPQRQRGRPRKTIAPISTTDDDAQNAGLAADGTGVAGGRG